MYVQVVTFELAGIPDEDFRKHCEAAAPAFTAMPGLLQKVWLGDEASNTYGGVYVWSDREAMERYVNGDVFARLGANPGIANVTWRGYDVIDEPTAITSALTARVS
jgi:quinol monooxygenase YgiN